MECNAGLMCMPLLCQLTPPSFRMITIFLFTQGCDSRFLKPGSHFLFFELEKLQLFCLLRFFFFSFSQFLFYSSLLPSEARDTVHDILVLAVEEPVLGPVDGDCLTQLPSQAGLKASLKLESEGGRVI